MLNITVITAINNAGPQKLAEIPTEGNMLDLESLELLGSASDAGKIETVTLQGGAENASFTFSAPQIHNSEFQAAVEQLGGFNTGITIGDLDSAIGGAVANLAALNQNGCWLNFQHHGQLPGKSTVNVSVPAERFPTLAEPPEWLALWSLTDDNLALEQYVPVSPNGSLWDVSFELEHCSSWALYPVGYNPNDASPAGIAANNVAGTAESQPAPENTDSSTINTTVFVLSILLAVAITCLLCMVITLCLRRRR